MIEYISIEDVGSVALVTAPPNWDEPIQVVPSLRAATEETQTSKEERQAFTGALMHSISFKPLLDGDDARAFRSDFSELKNQRCAIPWWTERRLVSSIVGTTITLADKLNFTCDRFILMDAYGNREILTADRTIQTALVVTADDAPSISPVGNLYIAPLILCRPKDRPSATGYSDELADFDVSFDEDAPYDSRLAPIDATWSTAGAAFAGLSTKTIFPIRPDFVEPMDDTRLMMLVSELGWAREKETAYQGAKTRRGLKMKFTIADEEISRLHGFFLACGGIAKSFFIPTYRGDLKLTASFAASQAVIAIEEGAGYGDLFNDGSHHPGTPFLAVIDPTTIRTCKTLIASNTSVTMTANFTTAAAMGSSIVSYLHLARFVASELRMKYLTDNLAECEIEFIECPDEYTHTSGEQDKKVYLYRFSSTIGDPTYYTSAEKKITATSNEADITDQTFDLAMVVDQSNPGGFTPGGLMSAIRVLDTFSDRITGVCVTRYQNTAAVVVNYTKDIAAVRAWLWLAASGTNPQSAAFFADDPEEWSEYVLSGLLAGINHLNANATNARKVLLQVTDDADYNALDAGNAAAINTALAAGGWWAFLNPNGTTGQFTTGGTLVSASITAADNIIFGPLTADYKFPADSEASIDFESVDMSHGEIKQSLNALDDSVDVKMFGWKGGGEFDGDYDDDYDVSADTPGIAIVQGAAEGPLTLEIFETLESAPTLDGTLIFKGECSVDSRGGELTIKVKALGQKPTRSMTWFIFQPGCNHRIYEKNTCGVVRDLFKSDATITAVSSLNNYVDVGSMSNSGGTRPHGYFGLGWIEVNNGSENKEVRAVLDSVALGSGVQRISIDRPLANAAVGDTITVFPGCDQSYLGTNGCPKFGTGKENRFGGFPAMPSENPSVRAIPLQPGQSATK